MNIQPTHWSPTPRIRRDIHNNSAGLMWHVAQVTGEAIRHGRKYAGGVRNGEVGALAWFFANGLRKLEGSWNSTLDDTKVSLKGVFCHMSGNGGPIVDFDHPLGGCELADLLIIVTQAGASRTAVRGNALFLQAKDKRWPLSGPPTEKQKDLYELADKFVFRAGNDVSSVELGENKPPRENERYMPHHREAGFKFWFFEPTPHSRFRYHFSFGPRYWGLASSTADPGEISEPNLDEVFPVTLVDFLLGVEGLGVSAPITGDFGWNRIVRDVVKCSINKAIAVPKKLDGKNPPRVRGWSGHALSEILAERATVVANPFDALADALGDQDIRDLSDRLANAERHEQDEPSNSEAPPPKFPEDPGMEGPGGGSFIWIELSERNG